MKVHVKSETWSITYAISISSPLLSQGNPCFKRGMIRFPCHKLRANMINYILIVTYLGCSPSQRYSKIFFKSVCFPKTWHFHQSIMCTSLFTFFEKKIQVLSWLACYPERLQNWLRILLTQLIWAFVASPKSNKLINHHFF